MSDRNNMVILERFMREASDGAPVWFEIDGALTEKDGFCLYEPTGEQPWLWVSCQAIADKLKRKVPQAVQVWKIPDSPALQETLKELGIL